MNSDTLDPPGRNGNPFLETASKSAGVDPGLAPNFAPKSMEFKGNRINLLSGLKRMFSTKGLVELGKAILKVASLFGICAWVIYAHLPGIIYLTNSTLGAALGKIGDVFPLMIGAMLVALLIIAAIDYA